MPDLIVDFRDIVLQKLQSDVPKFSDPKFQKCCQHVISKISADYEKNQDVSFYFDVEQAYFDAMDVYMRRVSKRILSTLNGSTDQKTILKALEQTHESLNKWIQNSFVNQLFESNVNTDVLNRFSEKSRSAFNEWAQILRTDTLSDSLCSTIEHLFRLASFKVNDRAFFNLVTSDHSQQSDEEELALSCPVCQPKLDNCLCSEIEQFFLDSRKVLIELEISDMIYELCESVLYTYLEKYICEICQDHENYDISCLNVILNWFEKFIVKWGQLMFKGVSMSQPLFKDGEKVPEFEQIFPNIRFLKKNNLMNFVLNTFIHCRQSRLFDIVIDFPSSKPILKDFKACIDFNAFNREKFVRELKTAYETRLLHPGVSTSDVIAAYITTHRALRVLDPKGFIMQAVCDPIRNYLTTRDDTIRCIIAEMTNDSQAPALMECKEMEELELCEGLLLADDSLVPSWDVWSPTPIGASETYSETTNGDILGMMVNIFDNNDLFVQEYQKMLAQRLLVKNEINLDFEYRNLELLSLRFQDTELQTCEVMLKDIKDSERLNSIINTEELDGHEPKMNALVLSKVFWPDNLGFPEISQELTNFKMPESMQGWYDTYKKVYEKFRVDRTLDWNFQLGLMKIDIELENGITVEHTVRPLQGAIIHLFEGRQSWTLAELSEHLDILPSIVRKQIAYWLNYGLIVEVSSDHFELREENIQC